MALMAAPAIAGDGQAYIEADVGAMLSLDTDVVDGVSSTPNDIGYKTGYDAGGIVGYDFGPVRLEGEVSYRRASAKDVTGDFFESETESTGFGTRDASGPGAALSGMANVLLDIGKDGGTQAFVGGGIGIARVSLRADDGNSFYVDDKDTGFAWQLLAGVRTPVSDNLALGVKYRFFNVEGLDLAASAPGSNGPAEADWRSHSVLASLIYSFGSKPAETVPAIPARVIERVAPAPLPPAPAIRVCNQGPYIVFFDWDRSEITPEAADTLDAAIAAYGNCGTTRIMLTGHADRSGPVTYNVGLSERRNAAVIAYLTTHGLTAGAIESEAFGETEPRVPTADGVREPQNRRVEITYGPNAGQ